ncbi:hypothetical protein, partial [Halioglobus sp. HI00S01]
YMVGLYYFEQETREFEGRISTIVGDDIAVGTEIFGPSLPLIAAPGDYAIQNSVFETETIAVFGQATWHVGDN